MLMYCDLWPKSSKIEQQTGLLLATLRQLSKICVLNFDNTSLLGKNQRVSSSSSGNPEEPLPYLHGKTKHVFLLFISTLYLEKLQRQQNIFSQAINDPTNRFNIAHCNNMTENVPAQKSNESYKIVSNFIFIFRKVAAGYFFLGYKRSN